MVYICFKLNNYYVLESFKLFIGSGVFWSKVMILEHFGDNWRWHPRWTSTKPWGRHGALTVDRHAPCTVDRHEATRRPHLAQPTWSPRLHQITELPLTSFNLILNTLPKCLGKRESFIVFILFTAKRERLRVGEKIQRDLWLELHWFYSIYLCFLFTLLVLCVTWLCLSNLLVRFRVQIGWRD